MIVKKVWMRLFIIGLVGLVLVGIFSVAMNIYEKKQLEPERYEQEKNLNRNVRNKKNKLKKRENNKKVKDSLNKRYKKHNKN
jgi:hypothetical protein